MDRFNASGSDHFNCNLCNKAGIESCHPHEKCICKGWYDGEFCQNCRFANEFILAPNGTCIPCPCMGRPIHECYKNKICTAHASVAFKEATAASALFIATLTAVLLVGIYLICRLIKRTKRLRSIACRRSIDHDLEQFPNDSETNNQNSLDDDGGVIWKDDEQLIVNNNHYRNRYELFDRSSNTEASTSTLFYIPSPIPPPSTHLVGSKSVSSYLGGNTIRKNPYGLKNSSTPSVLLNVENNSNINTDLDDCQFPKSTMKISSSCSEYYFLSVQTNDDGEEEEEQI